LKRSRTQQGGFRDKVHDSGFPQNMRTPAYSHRIILTYCKTRGDSFSRHIKATSWSRGGRRTESCNSGSRRARRGLREDGRGVWDAERICSEFPEGSGKARSCRRGLEPPTSPFQQLRYIDNDCDQDQNIKGARRLTDARGSPEGASGPFLDHGAEPSFARLNYGGQVSRPVSGR
jgi:hypothetical protein